MTKVKFEISFSDEEKIIVTRFLTPEMFNENSAKVCHIIIDQCIDEMAHNLKRELKDKLKK